MHGQTKPAIFIARHIDNCTQAQNNLASRARPIIGFTD